MIVATAGHIDHGKTTLVRALTGVDTDRLPEEKRRGISIDLGYAYWSAPCGRVVGFVDVPGHERFVRNMLAGVAAIDCALLIVAADDGVMPQTVEHLAILDLLGVARGFAVITKCDRVEPARVAEVEAGLRALLAPTALTGAPCHRVAAPAGTGIDELRAALDAAARTTARRATEGRLFRCAVDRSFSVAGSGTVVTGTVHAGRVTLDEQLLVSPSGVAVRVRGIQKHGLAAREASAGERCALNLAGIARGAVGRGDWVIGPALHAPTRRLHARLRVLASEARSLAHWTPVHLHLGTADVTARVALARGASIAPGAEANVELLLDAPLACAHGDRYIVRDFPATRTIGGGSVLDPQALIVARRDPARDAVLDALRESDAARALAALAPLRPAGVPLDWFGRAFNLDAGSLGAAVRDAGLEALGREPGWALAREKVAEVRAALERTVAAFHQATPQASGIEQAALLRAAAPRLPASVAEALLRAAVAERRLELTGGIVRRPGHDAAANPADAQLWQRVRPLLARVRRSPPSVREIAAELRLPDQEVRAMLNRFAKRGEAIRVDADRYYVPEAIRELAALVERTAQSAPEGHFTAAQFRDQSGIGRGLAIELLEYFDRSGLTLRLGDARRLRQPADRLYGHIAMPEPQPQPPRRGPGGGPAQQPGPAAGRRGDPAASERRMAPARRPR
jgi:selenocysteine-specific elongation factor